MNKLLLSLLPLLLFSVLAQLPSSVNAFCIFNCAAEDLKNRLQANVDCISNQISMGVSGRTAYGTEDLDSEGKKVEVNGQWLSEDELRKQWKDYPDSHSSNCYFIADITPQEVEKVYQDSLK